MDVDTLNEFGKWPEEEGSSDCHPRVSTRGRMQHSLFEDGLMLRRT